MQKGLNLSNLKQANRASILYTLNEHGAMSRKQIAEALGLTKAALSKITAELIQEGVLKETEAVGSGVGRKEVLLDLEYGDGKAFGVTFERDEITFSITSLKGDLLDMESIPFTKDFSLVKERVRTYYDSQKGKYNILGAGISIIGLANDYGFYKGIGIQKEFEEILPITVFVKNNVQAFSQAQNIYGELPYEKNVLMFKWGPGIGSSFIREGKVISGDDSGIAEIGHMIVNPKGKICRCGRRGCLETETALDVIVEDIARLGYPLSIPEILSSKEESIQRVVDEKISMVCLALMNASTILNANRIVLFGSVFTNEEFTSRFLARFKEFIPESGNQTIVVSNLNDKSSYIGSTAMVSRKLFFERYI